MIKKDFIQGIDYYLEEGRIVFTSHYLKQRGYCCGTGCRHCPYHPKHQKGNKNIEEEKTDTKNIEE